MAVDLINGRTPEEIKKTLDDSGCEDKDCRDCVYWNAMREDGSCLPAIIRDALALIQHLESQQPKWISIK